MLESYGGPEVLEVREVPDPQPGSRTTPPSNPSCSSADHICVVILADRGCRYLDTIYDDGWVEQELGVSPPELQRRLSEQTGAPPSRWAVA